MPWSQKIVSSSVLWGALKSKKNPPLRKPLMQQCRNGSRNESEWGYISESRGQGTVPRPRLGRERGAQLTDLAGARLL